MTRRKTPRRFTLEEDQAIVAGYSAMPLQDIATQLGRRAGSVVARAQTLVDKGLLDPTLRYHPRMWTEEEDDWLSDNWGLHPDEYVARHLHRSVVACTIRAKRVAGVSRKMAFWTARNVAELFGVDEHAITDRWIESGALKAEKSHVRCGDGYRVWRIDEEAVQAFIRQYPYHYDRQRIEPNTVYRQLAERVWQTDPWLTVNEAAAELGVHPQTVWRHIRRGWLQGKKTWEAGKWGGWRMPKSQLSGFRLRNPPITPSPALLAYYQRSKREIVIDMEADVDQLAAST